MSQSAWGLGAAAFMIGVWLSFAARLMAEQSLSATSAHLLSLEGRRSNTVVLVFQEEDCFSDTLMLATWRELEKSEDFGVAARVIDGASMTRVQEQLARQSGLRLDASTISRDAARRVAQRIGYTSTPFLVLVDADERVVAAFPGHAPVPRTAATELFEKGYWDEPPPRVDTSAVVVKAR